MKHEKRIGKQRQRRRWRVRNRVKRDSTRLRLTVFRSLKNIYVQIIDDEAGRTLASAGTRDKDLRDQISFGGNKDAAAVVGRAIAERAQADGIEEVVFDRGGYKYHGRLAALADAAREAGLKL